MSEQVECACCSYNSVDGKLKSWPKALVASTPAQRKRFLLRVAGTWFSSLPANKQRLDSKFLCNKHYKFIQDKAANDKLLQVEGAAKAPQRLSPAPPCNADASTPAVSTRRTRNNAGLTPLELASPSPAQSSRKRLDPVLATRIAVKAFDPYLAHLDAGRALRTAKKAPRDDKKPNDKAPEVKARATAAAAPKDAHGRRKLRAQTGPSSPRSESNGEEGGRPRKRRRREKSPLADEVQAASQPAVAVADVPPSQVLAGAAAADEEPPMRSPVAAVPRPAGTPVAGRMSIAAAAVSAGLAIASARKGEPTPDGRWGQPNKPIHGSPKRLSRRLPTPPRFPEDLLPHTSPSPSPVNHPDDTHNQQLPQTPSPVATPSPHRRAGDDVDDAQQPIDTQIGTPTDQHQRRQSPVIMQRPDIPLAQAMQQARVAAPPEQQDPPPRDEPQRLVRLQQPEQQPQLPQPVQQPQTFQPEQQSQPQQPVQAQQPLQPVQSPQSEQPHQPLQMAQPQTLPPHWRTGGLGAARRIVMHSKPTMEQQRQSQQVADPYELEVDLGELLASPSLLVSGTNPGGGANPGGGTNPGNGIGAAPSPSQQLSPMQRLMQRRLGAARVVSGLRPRQMWPGLDGSERGGGVPSVIGRRGVRDVSGLPGEGPMGQGTATGEKRKGLEEQENHASVRTSSMGGPVTGRATAATNAAALPVDVSWQCEDTRDMRTAAGAQVQGNKGTCQARLHHCGDPAGQAFELGGQRERPQQQQQPPAQRLDTAPQPAAAGGLAGPDNGGGPQQRHQEPAAAQQRCPPPPQGGARMFEGIRMAIARAREIRQRKPAAQVEDDWTLEEEQALQEATRNVAGTDAGGSVGRAGVGGGFQRSQPLEEEERSGGCPWSVHHMRCPDQSTGQPPSLSAAASAACPRIAPVSNGPPHPPTARDRWAPSGLYAWPDDDVVGALMYDEDGE